MCQYNQCGLKLIYVAISITRATRSLEVIYCIVTHRVFMLNPLPQCPAITSLIETSYIPHYMHLWDIYYIP